MGNWGVLEPGGDGTRVSSGIGVGGVRWELGAYRGALGAFGAMGGGVGAGWGRLGV